MSRRWWPTDKRSQRFIHAAQGQRGDVQAVLLPKLLLDANGSAIDLNSKLIAVAINHGMNS
jgi:hypothetical protein